MSSTAGRVDRVETRKDALGKGRKVDKAARRQALLDQWDSDIRAFRCYYTRVKLTHDYGSRRYATWEHRKPCCSHLRPYEDASTRTAKGHSRGFKISSPTWRDRRAQTCTPMCPNPAYLVRAPIPSASFRATRRCTGAPHALTV
jgi:hypothetical protein